MVVSSLTPYITDDCGAMSRTLEAAGIVATRFPSSDRLEAAQTDKLFYSVPASRALLAIAAMGQTDVSDLHQAVGLTANPSGTSPTAGSAKGSFKAAALAAGGSLNWTPTSRPPPIDAVLETAGRRDRGVRSVGIAFDSTLGQRELRMSTITTS